jgi:transposase
MGAAIGRRTTLTGQLSGRCELLSARLEQVSAPVVEPEHRLARNSSKPSSSDPPFAKRVPKRPARTRSGRRPGKEDGTPGRALKRVEHPGRIVCRDPATCRGCGTTSVGDLPARARGRVQYGRALTAPAGWLGCAHHLLARQAASVLSALLSALLGAQESTGRVVALRAEATRLLEGSLLPRVRKVIAAAPVGHADETCARAQGTVHDPHVARTEYLNATHVTNRTDEAIHARDVWPAIDGVLVRDGYPGYARPDHVPHTSCGARLLRDDDPEEQLCAGAMATTPSETNKTAHPAHPAHVAGRDALTPRALAAPQRSSRSVGPRPGRQPRQTEPAGQGATHPRRLSVRPPETSRLPCRPVPLSTVDTWAPTNSTPRRSPSPPARGSRLPLTPGHASAAT